MCNPDRAELDQLKEELGLHELAVEDALEPHQRPKLDHYDTHFFLSCHMVAMAPDQVTVDKTEIDAFVGDRWFITVRKGNDVDIDAVVKRWDRSADLARCGVPFLLYGLLDVVADSYFKVLDQFDDYYERVSEPSSRSSRSTRRASASGSRPASRWCGSTASSTGCAKRSARCCVAATSCPRSSIPTTRTCTTTSCGPTR